jgi:thioredoxin reductase (NADPH)
MDCSTPLVGSFGLVVTDTLIGPISGHEPATSLVRDQLQTDADGYIITVPGTTQTSVRGVFAAGDVQDKRYRQAITSAGSGCMAALEVEKLIAEEEELGEE